MSRPATVAAGVALSLAAVVTVAVAPTQSQLVFAIASSGANEVVVPFAYWMAVAAWALLIARLTNVQLSRIVPAAIAAGWALHVLVLLADFSRRLPDVAAFSTSFYRAYGRLFCAVVLMLAVGWVMRLGRDAPIGRRIGALDVPVVGGTAVLLVALFRFDPWPAALAVAAGLLMGPALRMGASRASAWSGLLQQGWHSERVFLAMVFLGAFALRVLYLMRVMTDPNYVATGGDGAVYDELAWSIAQGHGVSERFQNAYPLLLLGYVRFVAAVYALVGHSYFAVGAVQSAFGALTSVMLYIIAKPVFGVPAARVAAVFTAISFPLLFAAAAIGHQAIDVFLMTLLIWLLARAFDQRGTGLWRWAVIGVVLGYAIAVRETNAFFLALILIWMAVVFKPSGVPAVAKAMAALTAGAAVVLLPLMIPMVSSADSRLRLRQHFDRLYTGQGDSIRTRDELAGPLSDPGAALNQLREKPAFVVYTVGKAVVHNFAVQFFTQPFGGFDLVFLAKGTQYYYGMWFYAYVLAGAGTVLAARRLGADPNSAIIVLILGLIAARTLPHLILESHYRHRVPIEPFLILLAAVAVVTLCQAIRARDFQNAAPA